MKLGSLFDGSGGFPLAGALCGIEPIWASEIEPYPIAVTKTRFPNMKHLGDISKINGAEIEFIKSDMFSSIENKKFDVILSNPPYIKSEDLLGLQKEVKDFEPSLALDGGADGYDFYRIICSVAKEHLEEKGVLNKKTV